MPFHGRVFVPIRSVHNNVHPQNAVFRATESFSTTACFVRSVKRGAFLSFQRPSPTTTFAAMSRVGQGRPSPDRSLRRSVRTWCSLTRSRRRFSQPFDVNAASSHVGVVLTTPAMTHMQANHSTFVTPHHVVDHATTTRRKNTIFHLPKTLIAVTLDHRYA